jgi:hypothetical protein
MVVALILMALQMRSPVSPSIATGLLGSWVGTLEYRDYSDNSRQKIATLLRIYADKEGRGLIFRYVYDDGPTKVIQDQDLVSVDEQKALYSISSPDGKSGSDYTVTGLKDLHPDGTGTLILLGKGTENNAAVDVREKLQIQRNRFTILRESKLPGQSFLFRHEYDFVRVSAPQAK